MKKRKVFLINMERGILTDSVYERLCEIATPLLPVEVDDPYEGLYVLLVNSEKDRIEKMSRASGAFILTQGSYVKIRLCAVPNMSL